MQTADVFYDVVDDLHAFYDEILAKEEPNERMAAGIVRYSLDEIFNYMASKVKEIPTLNGYMCGNDYLPPPVVRRNASIVATCTARDMLTAAMREYDELVRVLNVDDEMAKAVGSAQRVLFE